MGAGLVSAQVQDGVRVAGDGLPGVLIQLLDLGHVLDDGAGGDIPGSHGGQLPGEARQWHGRELIQHKVDVSGQGSVMDLVGAVVEGLERLGIEQGHQEVKRVIVVRDHGIEGHLLLPQGIEVHVIVVGDSLDLGQVEGGQADSGGDQDALGGLPAPA